MDFVYAPVPFLIGVPRAYFDENSIPFEVVVVDLDTDRLRLPAGEHGLPKLPEQKKKLLKELSNLEHDLSLNRYEDLEFISCIDGRQCSPFLNTRGK